MWVQPGVSLWVSERRGVFLYTAAALTLQPVIADGDTHDRLYSGVRKCSRQCSRI